MPKDNFFLRQGVTLLELVVVIAIIAIVASIALPQFLRFKERALEKEAWTNLKLIQAAAWLYRIEYETYANLGDTSIVNRDLKLDLPLTSKLNYAITDASFENFWAWAKPKQGGGPGWKINAIMAYPQKE